MLRRVVEQTLCWNGCYMAELQVDFANITTDMPIVGFTGALGSGCSYIADGLVKLYGYRYCALSKPIHDYAQTKKIPETTDNLQDLGNSLRKEFGRGCLVGMALTEVAKQLPGKDQPGRPCGIVVDGIRNVGEIEALQQFPHFYLFSVQAATHKRTERTIGEGKRFATKDEFETADKRDRDEQDPNKQQVKECNDLSDIIVINEDDCSPKADNPYRTYLKELVYDRYVSLIEQIATGQPRNDRQARPDEAFMTAAYVESARSSCLKRKVGAVIVAPSGDIIATGHNEVPGTTDPCYKDPRYGWCARDTRQEMVAAKIHHCPACGTPITLRYPCPRCGVDITSFVKRCPDDQCRASIDIDYACPKCKASVFKTFLPGGGSEETGKLLDLCRALHAEENAILNLCRLGVSLPHRHEKDGKIQGCALYSTTFPCNLCANKIAEVGIRKVVYAEPYTMAEAKKVFEKAGIEMRRFQGIKSRAFFRFYA